MSSSRLVNKIFGYIEVTTAKIQGLTDPINPSDAANKKYVDAVVGGGSSGGSITLSSPNVLSILSTSDATSTTGGTFTTAGGLSVAKSIFSSSLNLTSTVDSTGSMSVSSLTTAGGVSIAKALSVGTSLTTGGITAQKGVLVTPVTSGTPLNVPNGVPGVVCTSSATVSSLPIVLPSAPVDGQIVFVVCTKDITSVSVSAGSNNVLPAITGLLGAGMSLRYLFHSANNTWYQV